jgi:transposase
MTLDEHNLAVKLFTEQGISARQINEIPAFKYYSLSNIYNELKGLKRGKKKIDTIQEMWKEGYSAVEIADYLNFSRAYIYNCLK